VAPAVSLEFLNERTLVRKGVDTEAVFELAVTNRSQGPREATVVYTISPGFALESNRRRVSFDEEDERRVLTIRASVREGLDPRDFVLTALVEGIDEPAHATARLVELEVPEARVGVIQSYDDTLADTFEAMGVPHETLEEAELTPARLAEFTTVLVDIRAYLVREDLRAANDALLKYVENGGTAIVMYQKTYEWEPDFAPYPLHVSRNRVTREDAEVTPLQPEHPVFTTPNPIEPGDWSGWAQERGLYFPDRWDERYTPLLAMSDPGEYAPPGSLLVAPYGEGTYVYTALVWYRQLRELHPGALRVFANMLAL
jgi:hypothetical protein